MDRITQKEDRFPSNERPINRHKAKYKLIKAFVDSWLKPEEVGPFREEWKQIKREFFPNLSAQKVEAFIRQRFVHSVFAEESKEIDFQDVPVRFVQEFLQKLSHLSPKKIGKIFPQITEEEVNTLGNMLMLLLQKAEETQSNPSSFMEEWNRLVQSASQEWSSQLPCLKREEEAKPVAETLLEWKNSWINKKGGTYLVQFLRKSLEK